VIRCDTCLIALQIADREDNNCPSCKDYRMAELMAKVKQANKRIENQPADDDAIPDNWQELQARDMEELANEDFSEPNQEEEFDEYTVWVGGTEVNDSLLEYDDAMEIADSYKKKGHTDVIVECVEYNEGA